jgi:hypothetical protein
MGYKYEGIYKNSSLKPISYALPKGYNSYDTNGPKSSPVSTRTAEKNAVGRIRTGTDKNGAPIWKYAIPIGGGSGSSKSGSGGGSGGRGGGGGGASKPKPALNLKVYHPNDYTSRGILKRATTQADAFNREGFSANQINRNSASNMYRNNIRELDFGQGRDVEGLNNQRNAELASNDNVALNRGMGYGEGYMSTQANINLGADKNIADTIAAYLVQRQNALDTQNTTFGNMDEQDRLLRANRMAKIDEYFSQYDDTAYNRYLKNEMLRQAEVDSTNGALSANYNSRY